MMSIKLNPILWIGFFIYSFSTLAQETPRKYISVSYTRVALSLTGIQGHDEIGMLPYRPRVFRCAIDLNEKNNLGYQFCDPAYGYRWKLKIVEGEFWPSLFYVNHSIFYNRVLLNLSVCKRLNLSFMGGAGFGFTPMHRGISSTDRKKYYTIGMDTVFFEHRTERARSIISANLNASVLFSYDIYRGIRLNFETSYSQGFLKMRQGQVKYFDYETGNSGSATFYTRNTIVAVLFGLGLPIK